MTIWLVEDDYLQAEQIEGDLKQAFPDAQIVTIRTESDFYSRAAEIAPTKDSVVVIDVLLRWCDSGSMRPPVPESVKQEGPYRGGIRCLERLAEREGGTGVVVIVYTVLDSDEVEPHLAKVKALFSQCYLLKKKGDENALIDKIRAVMGLSAEGRRP